MSCSETRALACHRSRIDIVAYGQLHLYTDGHRIHLPGACWTDTSDACAMGDIISPARLFVPITTAKPDAAEDTAAFGVYLVRDQIKLARRR